MAHKDDIALMAHLMRRAGFGATRDQLESYVAKGYEATVEELLNPEAQEPVDRLELLRYHPWSWKPGTIQGTGHATWLYHMVNTKAPCKKRCRSSGTASSPPASPKLTTGTKSLT